MYSLATCTLLYCYSIDIISYIELTRCYYMYVHPTQIESTPYLCVSVFKVVRDDTILTYIVCTLKTQGVLGRRLYVYVHIWHVGNT